MKAYYVTWRRRGESDGWAVIEVGDDGVCTRARTYNEGWFLHTCHFGRAYVQRPQEYTVTLLTDLAQLLWGCGQ